METKPPVPRAILVGIQVPSVDDVSHAASIEELGRLVKTLGYEVVGTMSQKRDGIGGATVLGKGRLEELAAITGGTGVVGSMAIPHKSKARERFEDADAKKPDAPQTEPDPEAPPKPEFVIVDHEISPSQARNLERATGAQVLDRTSVIVEIFHRHAHGLEAKLQAEIARLRYVSPRLRESSAGGGRQQGSGAGESGLDLDRRKIRDRLAELKEQLELIAQQGPDAFYKGSIAAAVEKASTSYLAPDITQAIIEGRQPRDLTAEKLLAHSRLPLAWRDQRTALGFA